MIKNIIWINTLPSTNNYVKSAHKTLGDGDLVSVDYQTKGKGQKGKNLLFSFLLKGPVKSDRGVMFKTLISVLNVLKKKGIDAKIKLPNDLLVDKRKITGILVERVHQEESYLVVGVGLNVNEIFNLNERTSMKMECDKSFNRKALLHDFVREYNHFDESLIIEAIKKYLVYPKTIWWGQDIVELVSLTQNFKAKLTFKGESHTLDLAELKFDYSV